MRQILVNLVGNAVKFTGTGEVRLVVGCVAGGAGDEVGDRECERLRVEVHDTGIGMTPDQAARIFEAFTQADSSTTREFGGSGLGLRISASLAEMLGGTIDLSTERGRGSMFALELPLAGGGAAAEGAGAPTAGHAEPRPVSVRRLIDGGSLADPRADDGRLAGLRLLLAEDAADVRELLVVLLRQGGAVVDMARDGLETVRMADDAAAAGSPYDAVLMDMQMPLLDGYAATRRLRATGHVMPIIAVTAHAMTGDRERCLSVGCDDHLPKPCSQAQLVEAIVRHVHRRGGAPAE